MRTSVVALVMGVSSIFPVQARDGIADYWFDGNAIHEGCQDGSSYVMGFSVAVAESATREQRTCIPTGVQAGQIKDVVCRHLANNPQTRQKPAFDLASAAITGAWPCPR